MLALVTTPIVPFLLLSIGLWSAKHVFRLANAWLWILAYPIGLALVGLVAYCAWLVEVPWQAIMSVFTLIGVMSSSVLFTELRHVLGENPRKTLLAGVQKLRIWLASLEPLETLLAAFSVFGLAIVSSWHLFVRPVVWDSLVLYDFRAQRLSEGWNLERFLSQFSLDARFAAYDFSHPFLSSVWQGLAYGTQTPFTAFLYLGLLFSVLALAWKAFSTRKAFLAFLSLFVCSSLFFTVWTQNYAAEPYILFWSLVFFLTSIPAEKRPQRWLSLMLLFLLTTLLTRVSEPYWLVFLAWLSVQVVRERRWSFRSPQTLLLLTLLWLPSLAVFAHWGQLQGQAQSLAQVSATTPVSSYDPARYSGMLQAIGQPELWLRWGELLTLKNPLLGFILVAAIQRAFLNGKKKVQTHEWLAVVFLLMLAAALLVETASDWPAWQGKERLISRAGLPVAALASILIARQIDENQTLPKAQKPKRSGRKRGK